MRNPDSEYDTLITDHSEVCSLIISLDNYNCEFSMNACKICGMKFRELIRLKRHVNVHRNKKPKVKEVKGDFEAPRFDQVM